MKIAVVGAGGVGGYYGALLAAAGNEVHFIARGSHLEAMRRNGLDIRSVLGDLRIRHVRATDQPSTIGVVDLALFCTKAFSTEAAAHQATSLIATHSVALSLQNGVEAVDQLGSVLGRQHVLAGATWLSSAIEAPGIIRHYSDSRRVVLGEVDGSDSERVREIQRHFNEAGINTVVSSNIQGILWSKLVFISAVAGFGSLTRLPIAAYRTVPESRQLLIAMMRESAAVAAALDVRLDSDALQDALEYMDNARPDVRPSMQLDVEAGRPSELEALIGVIVRKGRETGIPTPVASSIYSLLLPLELRAR